VARTPSVPPEQGLNGLLSVLDYVRTHGSSTRAQLVHATGLSRSVVTQRVAELMEYGLLTEGKLGPSTGGRAPRTLRFSADAGHLLVADIGATSIDVAVADLAGTIIAHRDEPCDVAAGPDLILARAEKLFKRCLNEASDVPGQLWGIGIGVPGPVEFETGRPVSPPIMPGWDLYPVRERFSQYRVPVWVDNDVNIMALGEGKAGLGRGRDNFVFVKIGTGIGAGIIVGGRLHRGTKGCAGDIGHIQVIDSGPEVVCRCGHFGCLEALAGGAALGRDAEAAAREGRSRFLATLMQEKGSLEARDVARAATHGDPASVELVTTAGRLVGRVVAGIVNFFNPSLVVIGGGVAATGDLLLATIRESVYRRSLPLATRDLAVQQSTLGGLAGVVGAAAMVTDEIFAPQRLARWLETGAPSAPALAAAGHS
jgi:glucokinase-like ROK family protein